MRFTDSIVGALFIGALGVPVLLTLAAYALFHGLVMLPLAAAQPRATS